MIVILTPVHGFIYFGVIRIKLMAIRFPQSYSVSAEEIGHFDSISLRLNDISLVILRGAFKKL